MKRVADWFFRRYCHPDYYDDIMGDLEELYNRNEQITTRTNIKHALRVIALCRPSIMRPLFISDNFIYMGILGSYFKTGSRNLTRQKLFSTINIVGLATGLAAFLLINAFVSFERGYDTHFTNYEEIHRLGTLEMNGENVDSKDANTGHILAGEITKSLPEAIANTVTYHFDPIPVRLDDEETFYEKNVVSGDPAFLDVFDYNVLQGNKETMLSEPHCLVLTNAKAKEYFPEGNYLDKTVRMIGDEGQWIDYRVTGIIEDVPISTHYYFDIIMSDRTLENRGDYNSWNNINYYNYLRIDPDFDRAAVQAKLDKIVEPHYDRESLLDIHPISDIYLHSDWTFEPAIHGNAQSVSFLVIISVFILVIAWVNYVNLSTARAINRAKEVGVRKAIGAVRGQLITQFLTEAFIVNLLACVLALVFIQLALPYFNFIAGKQILINIWSDTSLIRNVALFVVIGTLMSGFYPSIVLSQFKPSVVLRSATSKRTQGIDLRKVLVVVQFAVSIFLVAGTFIVVRQVDYMKTADKGIDTSYVIGLSGPSVYDEESAGKLDLFKEELRSHSAIIEVGATSNLPGGDGTDINSTTTQLKLIGFSDHLPGTTYISFIDDFFLPSIGLETVAGRNFDRERASDSSAVLANQSFVHRFGVADMSEVIGEQIQFGTSEDADRFTIIGVVNDFSRTSRKTAIEPTLYMPYLYAGELTVKLQPGSYMDGLGHVDEVWAQFYPDEPLDYTFIDDRFEALYENDQRFGQVFAVFSGFAILIASLGLFGLASFMAVQRTKEIGVRKVLGASITTIISLFYRDYLILLAISALIGVPAVYLGLNSWLEGYAFRVDYPWLLTIGGVLIVAAFALLTVGFHTFKVARINPASTLKHE